jgi:dienelactone hydrolase
MASDSILDGFQKSSFSFDGKTRDVYRIGSGPGVVVMHEIPGITPQAAGFAKRVAAAGFTVVMPDMFGTPGKKCRLPMRRAS